MNESEVRAMLAVIPSDDRELWIRIGMAIRDALGETGNPLWHEWSATSEKYRWRDAETAWRSFQGGSVTAATLAFHAKVHGYQIASRDWRPRRMPRSDRSEEEIRRKARYELAARKAQKMVEDSKPAEHPYLERKGFPTAVGMVDAENRLLIPAWRQGAISAVQAITPAGVKRFLPAGCRMDGARHRLGRLGSPGLVWIVEGYATGLSVLAALQLARRTDDEVVVCFSAGQLAKEGARYAPSRGRVVADRDKSAAGEEAARKTGLPYWLPPAWGDANDVMLEHGVAWLRSVLIKWNAEGEREWKQPRNP